MLYDPESGNIIHTHRSVAYPGATAVTRERAEERARALAARSGQDVSRLKALDVSPDEWNESHAYRVDVHSGQLVPITDLAPRRT